MNLYMLEPEVAGEIGENTIYDNFDDVRYRELILKYLSYISFFQDG